MTRSGVPSSTITPPSMKTTRSYLSLLDWKERWIDGGRRTPLHAPAQLEMPALEACVERIEAEGLDTVMARHTAAAAAARAGRSHWARGWSRMCTRRRMPLPAPSDVVASELVARALEPDPALPPAAGGGARGTPRRAECGRPRFERHR
jgi:hypothetical protein